MPLFDRASKANLTPPLFDSHTWLRARQSPVLATVVAAVLATACAASGDVLTQQNDNSRTAAYRSEALLKPSSVNAQSFGKLRERYVDGDVQAQPLYARNVDIPGRGKKNLIFVATAKNRVYAFDAENTDADPKAGVVWERQVNSSRRLIVETPTRKPGEICFETYNGYVGITGTPVIDRKTNTMYLVSWRAPSGDLNVFVSGLDGRVLNAQWAGKLGWAPWSAIGPPGMVQARQPVTAVWSNPEHLDLFVVDAAGAVRSAWWEADKSWQSWNWFSIGSARTANPGTTVTALWSNRDHLDLFVTDTEGSVISTWWEAKPPAPFRPGWQDWFVIGPRGITQPGATVTAQWSNRGHLDLFIVGRDGAVKSTWWEASPPAPFRKGWQDWFDIGPEQLASGTRVTAQWSSQDHLDLFSVGRDGAVKSTWWEANPPSPFRKGWQDWFDIGPKGLASPVTPVTAQWSNRDHLDLFIVGTDGTVRSTWWEANPSAPFRKGWQEWFAIGPKGLAASGSPVTAKWSNRDHLDLFVASSSGVVKSTWWEARPARPFRPGWQNWFDIDSAQTTASAEYVEAIWAPPERRADEGGNYIHAIDISTGKERAGSPRKIVASAPSELWTLRPQCHRNRTGLLLMDGVVYAGFGCLSCDWNCNTEPFRGWVLGFGTSNLASAGTFVTTELQRGQAGIWQSGAGLAGDAEGNVYFQTGNEPDEQPKGLGESFVKLRATGQGRLSLVGSYTVPNRDILDRGDADLGSGGPLILPGGKLIGGGKEGRLYLIDRVTMRPEQQFQAFINTYHLRSSVSQRPCCSDFPNVHRPAGCTHDASCFVLPEDYALDQGFGPNIHGAPAFWERADLGFGLLYKMPEKDFIKAFRYDLQTHRISEQPTLTGQVRPSDGMPGGFSSVSANGTRDGIVWTSYHHVRDATGTNAPRRLVALDASDLSELWRDEANVGFSKFTPPTIADGKVFLPTFDNKLIIYGLFPR